MSLNYYYDKVKNVDEVMFAVNRTDGKQYLTVKSESLIFAFMFVNLHSITEANAEEFFRRLNLWQHSMGSLYYVGHREGFFTLDDVKAHIGLSCNVTPWTAAKWNKYFAERLFENAKNKAAVGSREHVRPTPEQRSDAIQQIEAVVGASDTATLLNLLSGEDIIGLAADWHQGRDEDDKYHQSLFDDQGNLKAG